jgi:hypothetical protein
MWRGGIWVENQHHFVNWISGKSVLDLWGECSEQSGGQNVALGFAGSFLVAAIAQGQLVNWSIGLLVN